MGFEPMVRVLQTPALPLGDVAIKINIEMLIIAVRKKERAMGLEPTTFSLARRHSTN